MAATAVLEMEFGTEKQLQPEQQPMSKLLWGIDWDEYLPWGVGDGVLVHRSNFEEAQHFAQQHYQTIFEIDPARNPFLDEPFDAAKVRYMKSFADFFAYREQNSTIGTLICTPQDWSTYYIRSAATLPCCRGRKVVRAFFPYMFSVLRDAGVQRVEADTSPANLPVVGLFNDLKLNVTGSTLSERWGALTRFTKFLGEECETRFLNQFCLGVRYQTKNREKERR